MPKQDLQSANAPYIRYAQCWEDADVLLTGLNIQPGQTCLSIASGGENTLALLSRSPGRVVALDSNPAQIACLELKVAAFRELSHAQILAFWGDTPHDCRDAFYQNCRPLLSSGAQAFWDSHSADIAQGIGNAGKFERFFARFRTQFLPFVQSPRHVAQLLQGGPREARETFYQQTWDTWRWRLLFAVCFSRFVVSRTGRDPRFFRYAHGGLAAPMRRRVERALLTLDPADNPYLQWILAGRHVSALPFALRPENFETIRAHLDCLEWKCQSLESYLAENTTPTFHACNLSDVFEYMSEAEYHHALEGLVTACHSGARLAYWNMLVERRRPPHLTHCLRELRTEADTLHAQDKAFFYDAFVLEEVQTR